MAKIESEGYFDVVIGKPSWSEADRKGVKHANLELPCTTNDGQTTVHYMEFSSFMVNKNNQMVPLAAINSKLCVQIGMSEPFNPAKVSELIGKRATVQVVLEEWPDKKTGETHGAYRAKYINPPKQTISDQEAAALIAAALGNAVQVQTQTVNPPDASSTLEEDQIPF